MQSTLTQKCSIKLLECVDKVSNNNSSIDPSKTSMESTNHKIVQCINSDENTSDAGTTGELARDNSPKIAFNLLQYEDATASLTEANHMQSNINASDIIKESNVLKSSFSSFGHRNILTPQQDCTHTMPIMNASFQQPYKMSNDDLRCKVTMMTNETGVYE